MIDKNRQFRVLYRDFLARLIDVEIMAAEGDPLRLFGQFAALLGAFSFIVAIYMVPQYVVSNHGPERLAILALGDEQFLILTTMAIAGMFGVLAWDTIFPNRRDMLNLGVMPVMPGAILRARVSAIATGLGVAIGSINFFTGLSYPFATVPGGMRALWAYWVTTIAAGAFVFLTLLAVQGLAAALAPYRVFVRLSGLLQLAVFFVVLSGYFLTPGGANVSFTAPEHRDLLMRFPSFWFLGLYQQLNGPVHPVFRDFAARAVWALVLAGSVAAVAYVLAYGRIVNRVVDEPDISPGDRRAAWSLVRSGGFEWAIVRFTMRTLARSRLHRSILALYCGIGLAIALAYTRSFVYAGSGIYAPYRRYLKDVKWWEPNAPFFAAGFVLLYFAIIGVRATFSLPATLKANWLFMTTAVRPAGEYFRAVRKALYLSAAAPVWAVFGVLYFAVWKTGPYAAHMLVMVLAGVILIERSLHGFRKIPFACSYFPGQADLTRRLGAYGVFFLAVVDERSRLELHAFGRQARYVALAGVLLYMAIRSRLRWNRFAAGDRRGLQFEEFQALDVEPLDLRRDGAWSAERSAAVAGDELGWQAQLKLGAIHTSAVIAVLLSAGAAFEIVGAWIDDRARGPQIGRSYDIGGRSLNLHCMGERSPVVIIESGGGGVGLYGVALEREISKFAKVCWYDRAGHGWSDPAPEYPHPSSAIAADLHALTRAADLAPPFVIVGSSYGGFNARVYAGKYPEDVAGLVLADSSHFDERDRIPPSEEWAMPPAYYYGQYLLATALWRCGLVRLVFRDEDPGPPPKGMTVEEQRIADSFSPRGLAEFGKDNFILSAREARAATPMGARPMIVLTAGLPSKKGNNPVEARLLLEQQRQWIESHKQLLRFSSRSKQIVVSDSRHCISCDKPEAIVEAVREVIACAQEKSVCEGW